MQRDVISILSRVHGEKDPRTVTERVFLARTLFALERSAEAESILQESIPIFEDREGKEAVSTLATRYHLALVLRDFGRYADAEQILQEIIPIQSRICGDKNPHQTVMARAELAGVLIDQGRSAEAESIIRSAISTIDDEQGPEGRDTLRFREILAEALNELGQYPAAEQIARELITIYTRRGEEIGGCEASLRLVDALINTDRSAEAELILQKMIPITSGITGDENRLTIKSRYRLARVLNNLGRATEAEQILLEIIPVQERLRGKNHPHTVASRDLLERIRAK